MEDVFALFGISPEYERSAEVYLHPAVRQRLFSKAIRLPYSVKFIPKFRQNTVSTQESTPPRFPSTPSIRPANRSLSTLPYPNSPPSPAICLFVCDRATPAAQLEKAIRSVKSGIIEDVKLFDVYEGDRISADKKSVAYSLVLRAPDRTLTDEECTDVVNKVIDALSKSEPCSEHKKA